MVKVIAEFFIKKETLQEAINSTYEAVAETRMETGNISYEVYQDTNDAIHLVFIEEWKSDEALQEHMETSHFKKLLADITPIQEKDPVIHTYTKLL